MAPHRGGGEVGQEEIGRPLTRDCLTTVSSCRRTIGGTRPTPFFLGGLDTVRGVDFRSLVGDRAFFANAEFRFPLIDLLATPVLGFRGIRGVIFFDTGAAWFKGLPFKFYSSQTHSLVDGVAAYGAGFSFNLLGLEANVDFARPTTFKVNQPVRTDFWIGYRF